MPAGTAYAPLSMGKVIGDEIQCPYHGLRYDTAGRCTHMPGAGDRRPQRGVPSLPVRLVNHSLHGVWIGDPALAADPPRSDIRPDRRQPAWTGDGELIHAPCNYQLVLDNLMDLTHQEFVHSSASGSANSAEPRLTPAAPRRDCRWSGGCATSSRRRSQLKNMRDDPGFSGRVDRWQIIHSGALDDLHRRRRGQGRHGSARGRPQPGRQPVRHEPHHSRDRSHLLYFWSIPAQLPAGRPSSPPSFETASMACSARTSGCWPPSRPRSTRIPTTSSTASTSTRAACGCAASSIAPSQPKAAPPSHCRRRAGVAISHTVSWQQATVVDAAAVADRIRRIVLAPAAPRRIDPGMHVDVRVAGVEGVLREVVLDRRAGGHGRRVRHQRLRGRGIPRRRARCTRSHPAPSWRSPTPCRFPVPQQYPVRLPRRRRRHHGRPGHGEGGAPPGRRLPHRLLRAQPRRDGVRRRSGRRAW